MRVVRANRDPVSGSLISAFYPQAAKSRFYAVKRGGARAQSRRTADLIRHRAATSIAPRHQAGRRYEAIWTEVGSKQDSVEQPIEELGEVDFDSLQLRRADWNVGRQVAGYAWQLPLLRWQALALTGRKQTRPLNIGVPFGHAPAYACRKMGP